MVQITTFASRDALMQSAATAMAEALRDGISAHGDACAALSGGGTPEPAYALLAREKLDWPRVTFALVDERFVPPSDAASNEAMLQRALAPALAQGAKLAPLYTPAPDAAAAARLVDPVYAALRFDIALMGMGADGHTASWFAGANGLDAALDSATPRSVVAVRAPQAAGAPERLTLTLRAVREAKSVLLLITGDEKRARLLAAEADRDAPVAALLGLPALRVFWAA